MPLFVCRASARFASLGFLFAAVLFTPTFPVFARPTTPLPKTVEPAHREPAPESVIDPLMAEHEVLTLFSEEIRSAVRKLKWHGARLTEDTVYATALTGLSWREEWGKTHLFAPAYGERLSAWNEARRSDQKKDAIALALSLLLEPDPARASVDNVAMAYLESVGVDVDRVLLGILEAPDHLPGLPAYQYAAADLLAVRATPRLLPFLTHLVNSDDIYLRSRALIGLGIVAYQPHNVGTEEELHRLVLAPLREYGLSMGERTLIVQEIRDAAGSGQVRLRVAAALAAALMGDDAELVLLQKLARDRAYLLLSPLPGRKDAHLPRHILFPVRLAASSGLARFGRRSEAVSEGTFSGKALEAARRGGQDITTERPRVRHDILSRLEITSLDSALYTTLP